MTHRARTTALVAASTTALLVVPLGPLAPAGAADGEAPGAPGAAATWRSGDKDGIGTSLGRTSKVWYTLTDGTLSETYYPAADTPNVRDLGFVVSDGSTSSQRETDGTTQRVELADPTSLTYRQTTTDDGGRWRITKTYVTDPERPTVVMDVSFESLSGEPFSLYALYDPSLAGTAAGDSGSGTAGALLASDTHLADRPVASALVSSTGFAATSTGYAGTSDGWTDLADDHDLDATYDSAGPGNIVQTGADPHRRGADPLHPGAGLRTRHRGRPRRRRRLPGHLVRRRRRGLPVAVGRLPRRTRPGARPARPVTSRRSTTCP